MERKGPVTLSQKEQTRLRVIAEIEAGRWDAAEAARALSLSERQVRRLRRAYAERGAAAFMHGNRGRQSPRRIDAATREQVAALLRGRYAGCNDSHLAELLALREGIIVGRKSIERIRQAAGLGPAQRRRPPRHRSRRDRRPQEGMLLQIDGSPHLW